MRLPILEFRYPGGDWFDGPQNAREMEASAQRAASGSQADFETFVRLMSGQADGPPNEMQCRAKS